MFASAQMATDLVGGLHPDARLNERNPHLKDAVELQSWALMRNLSDVMKAAGADISADSVRIQQWRVADHPTLAELEAGNTWTGLSVSPYYRARNAYISEPRPASTGMGIRRLLLKGGLIGVDMIAIHPDAGPGKRGVGVPEGVPSPSPGTHRRSATATGSSWPVRSPRTGPATGCPSDTWVTPAGSRQKRA